MTLPRYFLLFACAFFCSSALHPQDKIYGQNNVIQGKITAITATEIKYLPLEKPGMTGMLPLGKALVLINGRGMVLVPATQESERQSMKDLVTGFLSDTNHLQKDQLYTLAGDKIEGTITKEDTTSIYLSDGTKLDKKKLAVLIYRNGQSIIYSPVDVAAALLRVYQQQSASSASSTSPPSATSSVTSALSQPASPAVLSAPSAARAADAPPIPPADSSKKPDFSALAGDVSKKEFEEKAEKKTTQFTEYLKILCDKTTGYEEINKAIGQATTLFVNENAMIETSSNNRNTITRLKIRDYLNKVKRVQYDKIEIEWTHVQYVSDLKPGPDGNFYGVVSFEQEFRGYRDGKLVYSDITRKNATVVLKTYQKNIEGTTKSIWDVLLSDIGVISTKSL